MPLKTSSFPAGTRLLFQQSTAPAGWVKDTTHNDKSLRVVNGNVSSGGAVGFSSFIAQSIGGTTLSTAQMPSHTHGIPYENGNYPQRSGVAASGSSWNGGESGSTSAGGNGSHTHSLNMNLSYVDTVICQKQ